jgi:hypothetical protein
MDYQAWCRETDQKEEEERKRRERVREEAKQKKVDQLNSYRERFGDYWYYPDGDVYVPIEMPRIPAIDGVNYVMVMSLDSETPMLATTLLMGGGDMNIEQYHDLYGEHDDESNKWVFTYKKLKE